MKNVGDLREAPYNPRRISHDQLERLGKSMKEFGDLSGIVVNVRTGLIVSGHQRRKRLEPDWEIKKEPFIDKTGTVAMGHIVTPWGLWTYREVDWSENKEKMANIAANKHGGVFDEDKIAEELVALDDGQNDMDLTGFDADELKEVALGGAGAGAGDEKGDVKFSEELGEENNYIVLKFSTETDWLQVQSLLKLDSVYSKRRNGKPWSKGVGRVVDGVTAIEQIRAAT